MTSTSSKREGYLLRHLWIVILLVLAATSVYGQESVTPLRELAERQEMYIGAAIDTLAFRSDAPYLALAAQQYNIITPENMFKFGPLSPASGVYDWTDADALVAWAEANNIRIHGHTLVWHYQLPSWLDEDRYSADEIAAILENHIRTVVGRYKGRIQEWDVVNEGIAEYGAGMRDTIWRRAMGDDYIAKAFQWAHEADPDALLFFNDYSIETQPAKADAVYNLVKELLDKGVPIDGVGLQMHVELRQGRRLLFSRLVEVMERFGALGLKAEVTEMDVSIGGENRNREEGLAPQAEIYRNVILACIAASNCDTVITWGMDDGHSWIPGFRQHPDWPLLFDERLQPKPAYFAVSEALAGAEQLQLLETSPQDSLGITDVTPTAEAE